MKNYSQNNEQQAIADYFGDFKGTFADIGSNDGKTLSNTYALALAGWKGILVEASPKAFGKLVDNYKGIGGCELHHMALAEKNGVITLNESSALLGTEDVALVSTVHDHEMERFASVVKYEKVKVTAVTWAELMKVSSFKHFDFISMDIEGSELEILPYMDLSKTKMICIEWNGKPDLMHQYERYLDGFECIHVNGENLLYARSK